MLYIYIYIYNIEKFPSKLVYVGLAQARPNYFSYFHQFFSTFSADQVLRRDYADQYLCDFTRTPFWIVSVLFQQTWVRNLEGGWKYVQVVLSRCLCLSVKWMLFAQSCGFLCKNRENLVIPGYSSSFRRVCPHLTEIGLY